VYTVWVFLDGQGEYHRIPREYKDEGTARCVFRSSKNFSANNEPMLMVEETAIMSDLATREPRQFTQYTALV